MTDRQTSSDRMVTSLFPDRSSAERAYSDVSARGYGQDDVNLVMSDDTRKRHFLNDGAPQTELGSKAAEGAGVGAGIGGAIGATLAAVAAIGTAVVIPGLGLIVADADEIRRLAGLDEVAGEIAGDTEAEDGREVRERRGGRGRHRPGL